MSNLPSTLLRSLAITAFLAGLACCATSSGTAGSPARLAASCIDSTGTQIAPPQSDCVNVPGRYSSRDINRTGVIDPAQALR